MYSIRQFLDRKGRNVYSIRPDAPVLEALKLMAEKNCGCLVVLDDEDKLVGVLSERDYARRVILEGRASRETQVAEICSSPAITISPRDTAEEGLALMTRQRVRHLPVVENEQLLGVVSIGDLVSAVIGDQRQLIEQLERYVSG